MKEELMTEVMQQMLPYLDNAQLKQLRQALEQALYHYDELGMETTPNEDEDYIIKSPVHRIHKVKMASNIKETYSDEDLEKMRDNCEELRDLANNDLTERVEAYGDRLGQYVKATHE